MHTNTDLSATEKMRFGSCLEHGTAHAVDHACWSRRDFLSSLGLAAVGGAFVLGQTPVQAFGQTPLLARLRALETDRVLVLVQLGGGNDGLNTIVPVDNDLYYNARPQIAIAKNEALPLGDEMGMHPSLGALSPRYGDGQMAVLQTVGYPAPSLSHFRATDIWLSGSSSEDTISTGWLGRYLDQAFPDFSEAPPEKPLAVQIGGLSSMLFQGPSANLGMSLASPELFERIAEEGTLYDLSGLPATTYGDEMRFVRTVANDSFQYADAVQTASQLGENRIEYPRPNPLGEPLAIVAQLIKGQLGARIYHVSLNGFDTHAGQTGAHANLLRNLAEAVQAFLEDLEADGYGQDVMVMTFSEFGRRVQQNASNGTDHGTAAPLFLFGKGLQGGLYGAAPDLDDLDQTGNLKYDLDFRSVYATLLQDWFGLEAAAVETVLGGAFETLPFVSNPATPTPTQPVEAPRVFALHQNYPNPFNPRTVIPYSLSQPAEVRLAIYDVQGRLVQVLIDGFQPAGDHTAAFDADRLPSGAYLYRIETAQGNQSRKMLLIR